jgi:putative sigma-54 modulation protein
MKIAYSGKSNGLTPVETEKLEARLQKLARFVDMKKGEREAHVALRSEKRLHRAEISMLFKGEVLATTGEGENLFVAAGSAVERLERQILKSREKRTDTRKRAAAREDIRGTATIDAEMVAPSFLAVEQEEQNGPEESARVNVLAASKVVRKKPLTVDEALLAIKPKAPYMVFRDAETDSVAVLIRRGATDFDLIDAGS